MITIGIIFSTYFVVEDELIKGQKWYWLIHPVEYTNLPILAYIVGKFSLYMFEAPMPPPGRHMGCTTGMSPKI